MIEHSKCAKEDSRLDNESAKTDGQLEAVRPFLVARRVSFGSFGRRGLLPFFFDATGASGVMSSSSMDGGLAGVSFIFKLSFVAAG